MVQVDGSVRSPSAAIAVVLTMVSVALVLLAGRLMVGVYTLVALLGLIGYIRWRFPEHGQAQRLVLLALVMSGAAFTYRAIAALDIPSRIVSAFSWLIAHPSVVIWPAIVASVLIVGYATMRLVQKLFPSQDGGGSGPE